MSEALARQSGVMNMVRENPLAIAGLTALTVVGSTGLIAANLANANEAGDGNNLVCGGVQSKAEALRLAHGGADSCGHRDIGEAWAEVGITPEVISTMHEGTVCSTDGLISEGRQHSPDPSQDKAVKLPSGSRIFERPLSVWGATCYEALVGHTEDGRKVAILEDCGNGEGHPVPKKPVHHPHPTPHHPKPKPTAGQTVTKVAKDSDGVVFPTPTNLFQFTETCLTPNGPRTKTATYFGPIKNLIKNCIVGTNETVTELPPLVDPADWRYVTPISQTHVVGHKGANFVFVDQEVKPQPGPTPKPTCIELGTCPTPQPPKITVEEKPPFFEGGDEGDKITLCAIADSNPTSDGVTVTASDKYTGPLQVVQQGQSDEYCAQDTLPNFPVTDDDVTFTARDNANNLTATDHTGAFPVRQPQ